MTDTFQTLPLHADLLASLDDAGLRTPTPIQARTLPLTLAGADVVGQAETGSGKTVAFGLPLLQAVEVGRRAVQGLVVCPTRELVDQVAEVLRALAARLGEVQVRRVVGGRRMRDQAEALARGCHVVVGTPGRLGEHLRRGHLDLSALQVLVLDEADRLLDAGFADEVQDVVGHAPDTRQTLLFSATFPTDLEALSRAVQRDPEHIVVSTEVPRDLLHQEVIEVEDRAAAVAAVLAERDPTAALVFCETKASCRALSAHLADLGASVRSLHGDHDQRTRDDVLVQFRQGSARVLVATDVAARGLDLPDLPLVVVAEPSADAVHHVHRVGRTARAGAEGQVVVVVADGADAARLGRIEQHLGRTLPRTTPPPPVPHLRGLRARWRTLLLLSGRRDKLRKGDVLGALVKDAGVPPAAVGDIDLSARTCAVAIDTEHVSAVRRFLARGRIKRRRLRSTWLD